MLDHVSITVTDLDRVERFYDVAIAALDVPKAGRGDDSLDYGLRCDDCHPDRSYLPILLGHLPERASRRHWCFKAADRAILDAFWTAGAGERWPGRWNNRPSAEYFAAFLLDPCGNRAQAVCRRR